MNTVPTFSSSINSLQPTLPFTTLPTSGDLTQIAWEIAHAYQLGSLGKQSVTYRQVIHVNGAPGRVYQAVRRLPAPAPDVFQRFF